MKFFLLSTVFILFFGSGLFAQQSAPVETVRDTGDAIFFAFTNAIAAFIGFIPKLIGAVLVLAIGWIISGFVATLLMKGLKLIGIERAAERAGATEFIRKTGTRMTASEVFAIFVKWFIRLIFVQAAAGLLGMPQVTEITNSIILFIPKVIVAMIILLAGSLIAKFLSSAVRGSASEIGLSNPNLLAAFTKYVIVGFAVIAAINQLGIAVVVNTLYIGLIASAALAIGLAFGLGGREVAAEITRSWYDNGRTAAGKIRERAEAKAAMNPEEFHRELDEYAEKTVTLTPEEEERLRKKR